MHSGHRRRLDAYYPVLIGFVLWERDFSASLYPGRLVGLSSMLENESLAKNCMTRLAKWTQSWTTIQPSSSAISCQCLRHKGCWPSRKTWCTLRSYCPSSSSISGGQLPGRRSLQIGQASRLDRERLVHQQGKE